MENELTEKYTFELSGMLSVSRGIMLTATEILCIKEFLRERLTTSREQAMKDQRVTTLFRMGRHHLVVNDVVVASEGDPCRAEGYGTFNKRVGYSQWTKEDILKIAAIRKGE